MKYIYLFLIFIKICTYPAQAQWLLLSKKKNHYFGVEVGKSSTLGTTKDEVFNGTPISGSASISYEQGTSFKVKYGFNFLESKKVWGQSVVFYFEPVFIHVANSSYEVGDSYLTLKRDVTFLGALVKFGPSWLNFGFGAGVNYINRQEKKADSPSFYTSTDIKKNTTMPLATIGSIELKKMINDKYQFVLNFTTLAWTTEKNIAITVDKHSGSLSKMYIYTLPENHMINTVTLGLNYYYDK